jgi:hypothetical protein
MKVEVTLTLKKDKVVKNSHVYESVPAGISGLYFPNTMFGELAANPPATIKMTLES